MKCPSCDGTNLTHYPNDRTTYRYARHNKDGSLMKKPGEKSGEPPVQIGSAPVNFWEAAQYWCNDCNGWCSQVNPGPVSDQHPAVYREKDDEAVA